VHVPELKDKVVIVTGSARGIGQAIAERFATEGSNVVLADLDNDGIESVAEKIITDGGSAVPIMTDVAIEEQVDALFDTALNEYGTVDVLVNNAGLISPVKHILEVDKAWWDRLIGANLTGTFLCARRAAHIMARKREGSIINMSSGGATKAHRAFVAYDASKGGIEAMTRALALDLGPYGVRVNCLVPGFIDTYGASEEVREKQGAIVPLGRMGEAADLAGSAVFLASSDAAYITGHRIVIDGGVLVQQRSANVDTFPPSQFPELD
jgi:NAD(P)-dependent dehydrogenase (short-subunit alcohol dehydrogenase family)|tara:strand:- start:265 stop:1065 length:801 start_codon:yes stop_codon:yes gene_type:complete